ncbi:hypothetical protein K3495_g3568 [Podosphaera aphanis]|nr:hypothetical protein K3495_g3568 [Podosphaera aphanis]
MSTLAITAGVVAHQQFGALPKRSASDLVSCVVRDIEEARTQKCTSTLVTLDVQGAFDAVLHNRLLVRMQKQGLPEPIFQWTVSFLQDRKVQREIDNLIEWASNNAVSFDTGKSEVIQFLGRRGENLTGVNVNGTWIGLAENIRWLGVCLDSQLTFKHHVTTYCGKAPKAAQHMRKLSPVSRGAAPGPLIAAVDSCVVPVATFAAEVWWPGLKRPTKRGDVTPPTVYLCNIVDKAVHVALRAALPVWRTTPNVILHREGGILPANILLEGSRLRLAAQINSLDTHHPLRSRASICPNVGTVKPR